MSNLPKKEQTAAQRAEEIRKSRDGRRPLHGRVGRFPELPKREGFKTHWFNDEDGQIELKLKQGWEFAKRAGFSDNKVNFAERPNAKHRVRAGTLENGEEYYAYAMDIPEDIYNEDRAMVSKASRQRVQYIKEGKLENQDATLNNSGAKPQVTSSIQSSFKPD